MKIKFLGAAGTVTGSSYVLTSGSGESILIDLGVFLGTPEINALNFAPYEFDCSTLSGAVLTHAHLDHCGRLPILLRNQYKGSIWMTPATRELTELSLLDSAKIASSDQKKQILFDKEQAEQTFERFMTTDYHVPTRVSSFTVTMRDAGHILGSASLEIVDNSPDSNIKKVVFSGDLGTSPEDLLIESELIDSADAVVMESTYGDRLHPHSVPADTLLSEIKEVESTGGTLLIPAFALDRTQEVLHIIMHLKLAGKIASDLPVYLDSPMATKATIIYTGHPNLFNSHIRTDFEHGGAFTFPGFAVVGKRDESMALHNRPGAKIIIAGSGMMSGGRVLAHAAHYLPIPTTRLFIVGYQSPETLGHKLLAGETSVHIDGAYIPVRCSINKTQSMSAHADQTQLLKWIKHIQGVKKIFLTHGDDGPRNVLAKQISEKLNHHDITLPKMNEEIQF